MLWKLWRSTTEPRGNSIFFFWSWLMTGCLTRFLPPFPRFIFSFRSFGIVSHLHKFENHDIRTTRVAHREGEKKWFLLSKDRGRSTIHVDSRDSIRHANVSWPLLHRQRERNTFRTDEMQTLARCTWSLRQNISSWTIHCPRFIVGEWTPGKDDSRILLWRKSFGYIIQFVRLIG